MAALPPHVRPAGAGPRRPRDVQATVDLSLRTITKSRSLLDATRTEPAEDELQVANFTVYLEHDDEEPFPYEDMYKQFWEILQLSVGTILMY